MALRDFFHALCSSPASSSSSGAGAAAKDPVKGKRSKFGVRVSSMGCACSTGGRADEEGEERVKECVPGRRSRRRGVYDSGELALAAAASGKSYSDRKFSDGSTRFGRAGLERAVEVLDTLGSSMTNLNGGSGFLTGAANRGNKVSILAFEVANTIAKASNLWKSVSDENIQSLLEDILQSDGVKQLMTLSDYELLQVAAADKREELAILSKEVIRFGDLCKDPSWHNLGRYFQKLDSELIEQDQSKEEIEVTLQHLVQLAQNTSDLYHESHSLDRFEQDFHRKFREQGTAPAAAHRESILILQSEMKRQRKVVKNLKKKSLWSRNLEEVVEKLVDIVIYLHHRIRNAFNYTGHNSFVAEQGPNTRLGPCGLALHYANIISQIENIVTRPLSLPPSARDNLYHGLPIAVKSALRSKLSSSAGREYTLAQIKGEMQKILRWLLPISDNTIRAHQGFGWVGEWAQLGSDMKKPSQQLAITRIQTLHHADKEKTEQYILELVVWLHHLVVQVKNKGYTSKPAQATDRSRKGKSRRSKSNEKADKDTDAQSQLSEDDRELLDRVSTGMVTYRRSRSAGPAYTRGSKLGRARGRCRSIGSSPARYLGEDLELEADRTRVLDILDGLDILKSYSTPYESGL